MMFKAILCLAFVANAVVAVPSHSRRHHDLAVRMASPNNLEPIAVVQKRSNSSRCKPRPTSTSSTTSATTTASKVVGNVASAPPTSTQVHSSSQKPAQPSSSSSSTTTKASSTQQSQPAQSQSSGGGSGSVSGPFTGDGTYYDTGLVACGQTYTDADFIVAVSHQFFDTYPGYNGVNPNDNPICGKKITAHYNGNTVTVSAVDRCEGCQLYDLDFTPAAIAVLDPNYLIDGRIHGVQWTIEA